MNGPNLAGRIAAYFLNSKLTPAIVVVIVAWGLIAIAATPRQENPQITMPAATIVTRYPGGSAREVEQLITERGERVLQQVPGVAHVYAVSTRDASIMTVLFHVGANPTTSFVDLYDHIDAHLGDLPPGASQPQITPLSVDDIPIVVLTLHGRRYNRGELYAAAQRVVAAVRALPGVANIQTYGGRPRRVAVRLDPARLAAFGLSAPGVARALGSSDLSRPSGSLRTADTAVSVHTGTAYASLAQVVDQVVGVSSGQIVTLGEVARVSLGWASRNANQTLFAHGGAAPRAERGRQAPAVAIAIAKRPGTNAVDVADAVLAAARATGLPPGVHLSVTRDDGAKANAAVNELIQRLIEAIAIVVTLLLILGWREALVVATAIPLTLFVTLGVGMLAGQSINRITLFALILALGLLVDDAIVVVENIHRHYQEDPSAPRAEATVRAVAEIGSPTALATLTVVLSFLPMLFVTGMMGPYMRPIPIDVPIALTASLLIAFAITPRATYALLRNRRRVHAAGGVARWIAPFRAALIALLDDDRRRRIFLGAIALAFAISASLPLLTLVKFRMLPRANESTFLVSIDAPRSSTVARTTRIATAVGHVLAVTPEVANYETFVGLNAVPDLSSLLQGTVFRNAPDLADIRVNLVPKGRRHLQSATLVARLRPRLQAVAARYNATLRILQTPPGPPVRDTILAKIYGPDVDVRRAIAARLVAMMHAEPGVVDVDSSFKAGAPAIRLAVDRHAAALAGVDVASIVKTLGIALQGARVATLHVPSDPRPLWIVVRYAARYRRNAASLESVMVPNANGASIPLMALVRPVAHQTVQPRFRDDFRDVTYVAAEMANRSSTYAVIDMMIALARSPIPAGYRIAWGGEWQLTLRVFADLGRAMLIAFLLIYFVLVARFRSFKTPLVVLAAVPLAVIGVMPGFALLAPFGVYFSATAMIGLIALIGIVVRNSIILIEFIEDKLAAGAPLREALIDATTARTRPIFLTAAAGVLSSIVIAADPVWSGLAWALVFGMTASAVLSVLAIPLLYALVAERRAAPAPDAPPATHVGAVRSIVTFPELGNFATESLALPRLLTGEQVELDAELFRGRKDAVDAVARVYGTFTVERVEVAMTSAYGELQACQAITLRSVGANAPTWKVLADA